MFLFKPTVLAQPPAQPRSDPFGRETRSTGVSRPCYGGADLFTVTWTRTARRGLAVRPSARRTSFYHGGLERLPIRPSNRQTGEKRPETIAEQVAVPFVKQMEPVRQR